MHNFGVLYQYEWKKLLGKKMVRISFLLCIVGIVVSLVLPFFGDYYVGGKRIDTNYNLYQAERSCAKALSGREINRKLLEETMAAYRNIPDTVPGIHYTETDEYWEYAFFYSEIFNFVRGFTGMQTSELMGGWEPDEEDMYARRQQYMTAMWEEMGLSEGEMDFWREREAQVKKPYVFLEYRGYDMMISCYQTVGILVLMLISICLSGMFSEEHARKTDQIILCSPLGKTALYWAKTAAGISFAVVCALVLFAVTFLMTMCLYGAQGFAALFWFIYPACAEPITCGQAVLIAGGNMLAAAIVTALVVMLLSEVLCGSAAALAVSTGLLLTAMVVSVPERYRVAAQIWDWLPWSYLAPWNVFGAYTFPVAGRYLTPWQAVPLIYLIAGAVIAAAGKPLYQRFQVSGR